MSWSASAEITVTPGRVVTTKQVREPQMGYGVAESEQAITGALDLAADALLQGVLGNGMFAVQAYGHSNPDHKAALGKADEFLYIGIHRNREV